MRLLMLTTFFIFFLSYGLAQQTVYTIKDTVTTKRLIAECSDLQNKRDFKGMIIKADSALVIYNQIYDEESFQIAHALSFKGSGLTNLFKSDEAIICFEKSLAIRTKLFGKWHHLVAQNYAQIATNYTTKGFRKKALDYALIANEIREKIYKKDDRRLLVNYSNVAAYCIDNERNNMALEYYQKALDWLSKYEKDNVVYISLTYAGIATVYNKQGQHTKAKEYFEKVLDVQKKTIKDSDRALAFTYNNLGVTYNYLGDYDKSIEHSLKSIEILSKGKDSLYSDVESCYRNIGISYYSKTNYEKAIQYFKKASEILIRRKGADNTNLSDFYTYIGMSYLKNNETDSALLHLQKAVDLQLKLSNNESSDIAQYYIYLGLGYKQKKNIEKTLEFAHKGITLQERIYGKNSDALTEGYQTLAEIYYDFKEYQKSLEYLNKALFVGHYTTENPFSSLDFLSEIVQSLKYIALNEYALYQKEKDTKHLERAVDFSSQAVYGTNSFEESINTEGSKSILKKKSVDVYETALKTNFDLSKIKSKDSLQHIAFQFAEQSKAKSLQSQINETRALYFSGISDSLLEQETTLKESIAFEEKERQERLNEGALETDSTLFEIGNKLLTLRSQYDSLKREFSLYYPDYYRLKYFQKNISISDIQSHFLTTDQTLLEYFVGDSSIFIFTINQKDFDVTEVKRDFDLKSLVNLMRKGIQEYHTSIKNDSLRNVSPINYTEGASKLYQKLIAPVESKLKKHIIIVPDDVLNYIPFEALIVKPDAKPFRFHAHNYLLNEHNISYAYSATLLKEMIDKKHNQEPTQQLLGMAPFFSGDTTASPDVLMLTETMRDTLQTLPSSGPEIANITKLMKGTSYYGKEATVNKFKQVAPQYRTLHLATHGKANNKLGDYSYLAFFNTKDSIDMRLYVRDLYNLNLNADMVVLSACETGIGELQRGEGIISLARAFSYAGAKSIITTLWQIGDEKSKILMTSFYKNLRKGQTKEEALSDAKREFIKKTDSDPFFWAGFIGIGDMNPIKK